MKKPFPFLIKLVDGFKIRHTLDPDFSNFHGSSTSIRQFAPKYYIPKGEYWLDVRVKDEQDFFIRAELITRPKHIKPGLAFRAYIKEKLCIRGAVPTFRKHEKQMRGYRLVMVDGKVIRQYLDPEFTYGGHDLVYPYIPKNEVWIETAMHPKEISFYVHHELVERTLMAKGISYDVAHEHATVAEKQMRRAHGGFYPGDEGNPWAKLTDAEIRNKYYVGARAKNRKNG